MEPIAPPVRRISRTELVGIALAAGSGTRLAPLTKILPKALCPVGNRALVDLALDRLESVVGARVVNAHHFADVLCAHIEDDWDGEVRTSVEPDEALGTAGGIARLRNWIDGRGVVIVNADAWSPEPIEPLLDGWDGETVRVMVSGEAPFSPTSRIVASTLPWRVAKDLEERPTGLYEVVWRDAFVSGELEVVHHHGEFVDCGTPAEYLQANLTAVEISGASIVAEDAEVAVGAVVSSSVLGAGSIVAGEVRDSVVWPGQVVASGERLIRSIRAGTSVTVGPL